MARKPKRMPTFFKVLFGDFTEELRMPPAFVKKFEKIMPKVPTLKSAEGKPFVVSLISNEDGWFFKSGWSKFVKNYDLEIGDILVFNLVNERTFQVVIYGKNGCEKELKVVSDLEKSSNSSPSSVSSKIEETKSKKQSCFEAEIKKKKQSCVKEDIEKKKQSCVKEDIEKKKQSCVEEEIKIKKKSCVEAEIKNGKQSCVEEEIKIKKRGPGRPRKRQSSELSSQLKKPQVSATKAVGINKQASENVKRNTEMKEKEIIYIL